MGFFSPVGWGKGVREKSSVVVVVGSVVVVGTSWWWKEGWSFTLL